jgi:hypothetical protein
VAVLQSLRVEALGAHICGRALVGGAVFAGSGDDTGDAEVRELDLPGSADEEVRRLDVAAGADNACAATSVTAPSGRAP